MGSFGLPRRGPFASTLVRHLVLAVVGALVLLLVTSSVSAYRDFQIANVGYYVVAVAGLTVLTGLNGQISLGHGALMMVGAYNWALLNPRRKTHYNLAITALSVAVWAIGRRPQRVQARKALNPRPLRVPGDRTAPRRGGRERER